MKLRHTSGHNSPQHARMGFESKRMPSVKVSCQKASYWVACEHLYKVVNWAGS